MQEPKSPVFEQPYGQDGECQERYEYEQVGAVLSVALLGQPLSRDVVHRVAVASAPDEQERQEKRKQRRRLRRFVAEKASRCKPHCGFA